ncbi:hypothetical protein ES705_15669 [subsurface metagenome]
MNQKSDNEIRSDQMYDEVHPDDMRIRKLEQWTDRVGYRFHNKPKSRKVAWWILLLMLVAAAIMLWLFIPRVVDPAGMDKEIGPHRDVVISPRGQVVIKPRNQDNCNE